MKPFLSAYDTSLYEHSEAREKRKTLCKIPEPGAWSVMGNCRNLNPYTPPASARLHQAQRTCELLFFFLFPSVVDAIRTNKYKFLLKYG